MELTVILLEGLYWLIFRSVVAGERANVTSSFIKLVKFLDWLWSDYLLKNGLFHAVK